MRGALEDLANRTKQVRQRQLEGKGSPEKPPAGKTQTSAGRAGWSS